MSHQIFGLSDWQLVPIFHLLSRNIAFLVVGYLGCSFKLAPLVHILRTTIRADMPLAAAVSPIALAISSSLLFENARIVDPAPLRKTPKAPASLEALKKRSISG